MTRQCDIIIPVFNQADLTINCLDFLNRHTDNRHPIRIIDDCSAEKEYLRLKAYVNEHRHITVLRREQNGGFGAAVNYGIQNASSEYICLLNNDTEVTPGWIETLLDHLSRHPEIGIVNPASNQFHFSHEQSVTAPPDSRMLMRAVTGFCMVFKRDIVNQIGVFDSIYGRGYFEDTDFCYRARHLLGLQSAIVLNSFVYHRESQSFGRKSKERRELKRRNREIFQKRWGVETRYLFLVPRKSVSMFRQHFHTCCELAGKGSRITLITNDQSFFDAVGNPFNDSLPHHGSIKAMYIGLPYPMLFVFAFLKWITSGKRYAKLRVFTKRFSSLGDNAMFVSANRYHQALANMP